MKIKPAMCQCGSCLPYEACCGRFLSAGDYPMTPQALMRSRYSAYVQGNMGWIAQTWADETRPQDLRHDDQVKWLGLKVIAEQLLDENHATVEFVARGRAGGEGAFRMHEISRFERRHGRWVYVDGDLLDK